MISWRLITVDDGQRLDGCAHFSVPNPIHITIQPIQYNTIQYNTIQSIQYNTIQYNHFSLAEKWFVWRKSKPDPLKLLFPSSNHEDHWNAQRMESLRQDLILAEAPTWSYVADFQYLLESEKLNLEIVQGSGRGWTSKYWLKTYYVPSPELWARNGEHIQDRTRCRNEVKDLSVHFVC